MPDENPPTTTTAPAATTSEPVTPPAGGAPVAFTPEQQEALNRIVQQRLTEDRARRPATPPAPAAPAARAVTPTAATATAPEQSMTVTEFHQQIARTRAFERVTAPAGLTDRQVERMESALRAENPADVSQWSRDYLADMKLGQPATATTIIPPPATATQTATLVPDVPRSPAAAPSAPTGHGLPLQNGIVDIFSLSEEQRKAMGPSAMRAVLEQLMTVGNQQSGIPARPKPPSQR